ncbi:hypothetical protein SDJN02_14886 [Cucurbita argyrosperma subsp. argyrosperma]|nr:hypothetical protein SDJN02_14886 [Cucurbita argyrosperma subsp. argyrosperma]
MLRELKLKQLLCRLPLKLRVIMDMYPILVCYRCSWNISIYKMIRFYLPEVLQKDEPRSLLLKVIMEQPHHKRSMHPKRPNFYLLPRERHVYQHLQWQCHHLAYEPA